MAGGVQEVDSISPEIIQAARCGVMELNARSNSLFQQQLVRVTSATSQVVAGIKYTLHVATGESSACRNDGQTRTLEDCPVDGEEASYVLSVLVQAWQEAPCELLDFTMVVDADVLEADDVEESGSGSGDEAVVTYECIEDDYFAAGHEYCVGRSGNMTQPLLYKDRDWPADAFADFDRNAYCCQYLRHGKGKKKGCGKKKAHGRGKATIWGLSPSRAMLIVGLAGSALVLLAFACMVHRRRRRSHQYRLMNGVQVVPVACESPVKAPAKVTKSSPQYFGNPAYHVPMATEKARQSSSDC